MHAQGKGACYRAEGGVRSSSAFTLLELLVVVSVTGLLLALLLPGLRGVRETGRQTVCASNVRQLQLANGLYAHDHKDHYAPGAADIILDLRRWHGSRQSTYDPFTPEGGALTAYLGDSAGMSRAVRTCPSFAGTLALLVDAGAGFERSSGGYGYNNAYMGVRRHREGPILNIRDDRVGSGEHQFGRPWQTIAFTDSAIAAGGPVGIVEYSFADPRFWPDLLRWRADPTIHFRHASSRADSRAARANVAWLDGHVSAEARTFTWTSGVYLVKPGPLGLGWPGKNDTNELFDYE